MKPANHCKAFYFVFVAILLGFMLAISVASYAEEPEEERANWYVSASVGWSASDGIIDEAELKHISDPYLYYNVSGPIVITATHTRINDGDEGYSIAFGYSFQSLDLEISYTDFGVMSGTFKRDFVAGGTNTGSMTINATIEIETIALAISKELRVFKGLYVRPTAGVSRWSAKVDSEIILIESANPDSYWDLKGTDDGFDVFIGLVAGYDLNQSLSLHVSWKRQKVEGADADLFGGGLQYYF